MNLIDKYVYAVTEKLPEGMREDIKRELRANIEDMLPENPSEEDIKRTLERLGNPVRLANEYSGAKRYLIGPDVYDSYISVLKLVTGIVAVVFLIISVIEKAANPIPNKEILQMTIDMFAHSFGAVIEGIIHGFIWVTLVFAILERTGINEGKLPFIKQKWSVDDLKEMEVSNKKRISRVETSFGMFFTVLLLSIFYFHPEVIGIYGKADGGIKLLAPLVSTERLQYYMLAIIILGLAGLLVQVWKFITMKWNISLAAANALVNFSACILLFVMIGDAALFNASFLPSFSDLTNIALIDVNAAWNVGGRIFVALFVLANVWDSISGFINSVRK